MTTQIITTQRTPFGKFVKWVFICFNLFMLLWLVLGVQSATHDYDQLTDIQQTGTAIGTTIGAMFILIIWGMGDLILGLLVLFTRGPQVVLTDAELPIAQQWSRKKKFGVVALVIVAIAIISNLDHPSSSTSTQSVDRPSIKITDFRWHKDAFGTVMMASFVFENTGTRAAKDIKVRCDHSAASGTHIDSNTKTIYQIIGAGQTLTVNDFNMGFILSQAERSSCVVLGVTAI